MRKYWIFGIVLVILCVVVVLALLNLNTLINRNKDYLLSQAEQALGRRISVGEIGLTLWSGIGIRLNNFSLSDDRSFSSGDFVRAGDLQVNLKLLPLLRREFQIKRIILNDPVVGIIRNRQGVFNFSSIGGRKQEKETPRDAPEPDEKGKKKAPPPLLVSLVNISSGEVHYLDRKEGIDLRVKQFDFRVKDLDFGKPFSVALAAALFSEKQNLRIETRVGPISADGDFSDVPLEGELDIGPIDIGKLEAAIPKMKSALPKELDLSGIFRIKDLQLTGSLKKLAVKGTLEGNDGSIKFGKTFQKASGVPLEIFTDAQYGNNTVSFRQAKLKLHTLDLSGKGEVKLGDVPSLNLSLESSRFSLNGWEKILPLIRDYQLSGNLEIHTNVQGKVGKGATPRIRGDLTLAGISAKPPQLPKPVKDLNAKINFTGQSADLKETSFNLGNSRIRLEAGISRFAPLTVSYRLSSPEVRPADYEAALPDERKADVLKEITSEGQLSARNGSLTFQGKIGSAQGTLYRIGYRDLGASLVLQNNVANIRDLRVNALNGSVQAEGEYSFKDPKPRFSLNSRIRGLDLKELYRSLGSQAQRDIRGNLNADATISGRGNKWDEIKSSLRGRGEAEVLQGAILNFNLAEGVFKGITGIPGLTSFITPQVRQKYPETFESKDTEFKELKGQFSLEGERMNIKDLRITAADYTVLGNGTVDFNRRVDFRSLLIYSERLSADMSHAVKEFRYAFNDQNRFEIPFVLSGTLPKAKPVPDSGYLAKMIQRGLMRRGTEEIQRRIFGTKESTTPPTETEPAEEKSPPPSPAEELIRKGLEGLFGR